MDFDEICTVALAGEMVYEATMMSKIDLDGLNFLEIVTYLAINMNDKEIRKQGIFNLLPRRRHRKGCKPTITGNAALGAESTHYDHWFYPRTHFTTEEKKLLFANCLQIGIMTLFRNHLYQFCGKIFRQNGGAPSGLRVSCPAARIVMNCYDKRLTNIMMTSEFLWPPSSLAGDCTLGNLCLENVGKKKN